MTLSLSISKKTLSSIKKWSETAPWMFFVVMLAIEAAILSSVTAYFYDVIVAYGDSESHLNISKRVVTSLTPGLAQLGGIWLPLPHLLMMPFVWNDFLWYTGIAGSIVSGMAFVVSAIYLYKFAYLITKNKLASFVAFLAFASNPNILYIQATPMTEMLLIAFFILSSYYFTCFLIDRNDFKGLMLAAIFGFCASLSRYDGWFLVLFESMVIILRYLPLEKKKYHEMEGKLIIFSTHALIGIALWLFWDYLILGDPFYFTNSQFSAKSQQSAWLARGELPAYHNPLVAFIYYFATSMSNSGILIFLASFIGLYKYIFEKRSYTRFLILIILLVPFVFYVFTMYVGQSVIFIPSITPTTFEWTLFNVRYGLMMVPVVAFFFAFAFYKSDIAMRVFLIVLLFTQFGLYTVGFSKVVTLADGTEGLSRQKKDFAEVWLTDNYDDGYVLIDDYARSISITRTRIPMQNIIYLGNKPYFELALRHPEKYAKWVIMQRDDIIWRSIYDVKQRQDDLYKHYEKAYTSPTTLIFKRMDQYDTDFRP